MVDLSKVKPEYLWYIIGFIATDGNLSKDGRHINITSKDRDHLFLLRDTLGLQSKIGRKGSGSQQEKKYSQLQFSDVKFYRYLESIGICAGKSLTLGRVEVNWAYFPDFLRGVIDGDGCICTWIHKSNTHRQWVLQVTSAALVFITWLKESTETYFRVRGKLHTYPSNSKRNALYVIKFGKLAAKIILKQIYYENSLSLERKMAKSKICLQDVNRMVNYGHVLGPGAVTGSQN